MLLLLTVLLVYGTAVAQEFDLGPIPPVEIECFAESEGASSLAPDPRLDGSWLQFRRDRKLTGRSPLIGNITCPEVLWSIDLGARKHYVAITPGIGQSEVQLPTSDSMGESEALKRAFGFFGRQIDLNGDGEFIVEEQEGDRKTGDWLTSLQGFERVICFPSFGLENHCY